MDWHLMWQYHWLVQATESSGYIGLLADIYLIGVRLFLFLTAFSCLQLFDAEVASHAIPAEAARYSGFLAVVTCSFVLCLHIPFYWTLNSQTILLAVQDSVQDSVQHISKFQFNSHYWCIWDLFSSEQPPTISDKKLTKP